MTWATGRPQWEWENMGGYRLLAIVVVLGSVVYFTRFASIPSEPDYQYGQVAYVLDGDTIRLVGLTPSIRLWGVDAPEKGKKGAHRATMALKSLVKNKNIAYLEMDRDRYQRIVARVFVGDDIEVNRRLIVAGDAREYCKYSKGFYKTCTE